MAENKKRLFKVMPSWFSLDKYKFASDLDAYGWWLHLSRRKAALGCIEDGLSYDLSNFFENPIISTSEIENIKARSQWIAPLANLTPNAPRVDGIDLFTDTVRPLPLLWIAYGECNDLTVVEAASRSKKCQETHQDKDLLSTPYDLYLKKRGLSNDGFLLLEVDANATDEQILADFKIWLEASRKEFGHVRKRAFTAATFKEWVSYGVLPYLDLMIWAESKNARLAQHSIGRAIYPDNDASCLDPTERIRRTTKVKADWLMDWTVLRALEIQASACKTGMKN